MNPTLLALAVAACLCAAVPLAASEPLPVPIDVPHAIDGMSCISQRDEFPYIIIDPDQCP